MSRRINPQTDPCKNGHYGQWFVGSDGWHACRLCKVINQAKSIERKKTSLSTLNAAYRSIPGAVAKAAEMLHLSPTTVHRYLVGWIWAPRWRVAQLKAVLELCIVTNGNGHKA